MDVAGPAVVDGALVVCGEGVVLVASVDNNALLMVDPVPADGAGAPAVVPPDKSGGIA